MPIDNDNPKTFMDAQLAYAKSKHGKEQKRKDTQGGRYHQIKRAADKIQQSYDDDGKEGKR